MHTLRAGLVVLCFSSVCLIPLLSEHLNSLMAIIPRLDGGMGKGLGLCLREQEAEGAEKGAKGLPRHTTMPQYISDHKNHGEKKPGKKRSDGVAVLRQGSACTRGSLLGVKGLFVCLYLPANLLLQNSLGTM